MFWKFHLTASGLDTLLAKEGVTLKEVLDEEDVLQECKTQNSKLIEFLSQDEILPELLDLAITIPPEDSDLKTQFKYPNLACEVICSDIDAILDKLVSEKTSLDKLWGFLDLTPPLNPLIASFFARIVGTILMKRGPEVFESIQENDVVDKLLVHLEVSAAMDVFVKLMSVIDSSEMRRNVENLLEEQEFVQKLVKRLSPQYSHEMHCNSSNLLSELVRVGRESPSRFSDQPEEPSTLCNIVDKEEILSTLIDTILSDRDSINADSSLVNGVDVLLSIFEFKRPNPEGLEELFTPVSAERIAQGVQSALNSLSPRLKDFHALLVEPPPQNPMLTTVGILDPPLGRVRLHIVWLISASVATNNARINKDLAELGTINVILDLFFKYQWNNFLHTHVEHCVSSILSSDVGGEDGNNENPLLVHLFQDCALISRIVNAWADNESQQSQGKRQGYMGHLTRIANSLAANLEKGPNSNLLQSLLNELSDDLKSRWKELTEGPLNDLNTKNATQMQFTSPMLHSSSEDDDDGTFKPVSILQYENSLQQAFSNYQVQQMSNEFIESFGHNEDDLNQFGKSDNPFDEIGNVNFSIDANNETPDAQLFEAVCNEKIQQFDDSGSEDEDVWEEKELKFSPSAKRRPAESNSDESEESSDEASDSSDDEPVFSDESKQKDPFSEDDKVNKETVDSMEIEDWTANFESSPAMDTQDAPAVGWVTPEATTTVRIEDEAGFADFTDISKFESETNDGTEGQDAPMAVDEDSSDSCKESINTSDVKSEDVQMKEDSPDLINEQENDDGNKSKLITESDEVSCDRKDSVEQTETKQEDHAQEDVTKLSNLNAKDCKVDVFETGDDSMHVTSHVIGGFVVIDANASEEKKNIEAPSQSPEGDDTLKTNKDSSPSKGGVSVVTVSSRHVININSDGKIESPRSPRSPRSPKKSKSPTRVTTSTSKSSPKKLLEPGACLNDSPPHSQNTISVEKQTTNGPVLDNSSISLEKQEGLEKCEISSALPTNQKEDGVNFES